MKWILIVVAVHYGNAPAWYRAPGDYPSKAACEEVAKQFGMFGARCYPDAQTLPTPPTPKLTNKEINSINREGVKMLETLKPLPR
jgi:hypothetical protein